MARPHRPNDLPHLTAAHLATVNAVQQTSVLRQLRSRGTFVHSVLSADFTTWLILTTTTEARSSSNSVRTLVTLDGGFRTTRLFA